ncbi:DUF2339 domain-containing protein [Kingella oralis]|uniref:DUF2339 domain-containing protein n=1 Tax=Kingella oralis TaxID=505 RepID=UPI002D7F2EF9|nr:DUF2339 domain-containing protein [Kingella oralis]
MNFLLFVVLPALVIGAMTHYSAGVEAFLILCAVWLRDLTRDNQQQAERKQQDNKLRDLQNELDILHQRINHLRQPENATTQAVNRQPENDLPADAAARESLRQPENRLSVSRETARQPETRVTPAPVSAQPSAHPSTPQPVHPPQSIGQPENHPTHQDDEFNLDALDALQTPAQSITPSTAQPITQPPAQPAPRQPETATAAQTPVRKKPQSPLPHRQPETAWQNNEAEAAPNPLIAWFLRGNPLLKIGVVVLFFGLAFLLRYVGSHLPLWFKYLAVFGAGIAAALAGEKLHTKNREYGLVLQGFGFGVMYLTTLAALKWHHLLAAPLVFAVMLGAVALMAALAVRRDAKIMAQFALVGGLAAPVLISDGSGNYLVLFSYLALLNTAVAWIAWHKAWRDLNITGFVGTFAIALSWGMHDYTAAHFARTEPFLLYHWLLYTAVACFFARQTLAHEPFSGSLKRIPNDAPLQRIMETFAAYASHIRGLDSTLLFGTAITAFSMQYQMVEYWQHAAAASAVGFAAVYAGFALWFARQGDDFAVMKQAFAALSLLFVTLAVPLEWDGAWTASAWALEAALVYVFGMKLRQPHTRLAALVVFVLAAVAQLGDWQLFPLGSETLMGGSVAGTLWLMAGGAAMVWTWLRQPEKLAAWENSFQAAVQALALANAVALPMMLWGATGTAYAMAAYALTLAAAQFRRQNKVVSLFAVGTGWLAILLAATSNHGSLKLPAAACVLAAAFLLHRSRWQPENAVTPNTAAGWALLPFAALLAMAGVSDVLPRAWSPSDFWAVWWAVWPPLLAASRGGRWKQGLQTCAVAGWLYAWSLFYAPEDWGAGKPVFATLTLAMMTVLSLRAMTWQPEKLWRSAAWHGIALAVFGAAWTAWLGKLGGRYADGVWAQLAWLTVPMLLWTAFTAWRNHPRLQPRAVYWRWGSMAAAVFALAWLLWANWSAPRASGLPYLPLLNPLELATATIVWQAWRWCGAWLPEHAPDAKKAQIALPAALALFAVSALVMRVWHEYDGVAWRLRDLLASFGLQASLSIVWALLAIGLMVRGNQKAARALWFTGAGLMGVVVAKLFLVELGNSGGVARIVSFIVVGLLLLLVGWFAPMPPRGGEGEEEG